MSKTQIKIYYREQRVNIMSEKHKSLNTKNKY